MKSSILIYVLTFLVCVSIKIDHRLASVSKNSPNAISIKRPLNKIKRGTIYDILNVNQYRHEFINKTELSRRIALEREMMRKEHEMRQEEERRAKIFRQYLASFIRSSFIRDFHTARF